MSTYQRLIAIIRAVGNADAAHAFRAHRALPRRCAEIGMDSRSAR